MGGLQISIITSISMIELVYQMGLFVIDRREWFAPTGYDS